MPDSSLIIPTPEELDEIKKLYIQSFSEFIRDSDAEVKNASYFKDYFEQKFVDQDEQVYRSPLEVLGSRLPEIAIHEVLEKANPVHNPMSSVNNRQQSCIRAIEKFRKDVIELSPKLKTDPFALECVRANDIFSAINSAISSYYKVLKYAGNDREKLLKIFNTDFINLNEDDDLYMHCEGPVKDFWGYLNEAYKKLLLYPVKNLYIQKCLNMLLENLVPAGAVQPQLLKAVEQYNGAPCLSEQQITKLCNKGGDLIKKICQSPTGELPYDEYRDLYKGMGLEEFRQEYHNSWLTTLSRLNVISLTKYVWRNISNKEQYVKQRMDHLTAVICITWALHNESLRKYDKLLTRGSINIYDHYKINNFLRSYVEFATGSDEPGYFTGGNKFAYSRNPQHYPLPFLGVGKLPLSSHYKEDSYYKEKVAQYAIDVRVHSDDYPLPLLPHGCCTILFGAIQVNRQPLTFFKIEPYGIADVSEAVGHMHLLFKSWFEKTSDFNREKDIPVPLIKPFNDFCAALGVDKKYHIKDDGKCCSGKIQVWEMCCYIIADDLDLTKSSLTPEQKEKAELAKNEFIRILDELKLAQDSDVRVGNECILNFSCILPATESTGEEDDIEYSGDFVMVEGAEEIEKKIEKGKEKEEVSSSDESVMPGLSGNDTASSSDSGGNNGCAGGGSGGGNVNGDDTGAAVVALDEVHETEGDVIIESSFIVEPPVRYAVVEQGNVIVNPVRYDVAVTSGIGKFSGAVQHEVAKDVVKQDAVVTVGKVQKTDGVVKESSVMVDPLVKYKIIGQISSTGTSKPKQPVTGEHLVQREAEEHIGMTCEAIKEKNIARNVLKKLKQNVRKKKEERAANGQQLLKTRRQRYAIYMLAGIIAVAGVIGSIAAGIFGGIVAGAIVAGITVAVTSVLLFCANKLHNKKTQISPAVPVQPEVTHLSIGRKPEHMVRQQPKLVSQPAVAQEFLPSTTAVKSTATKEEGRLIDMETGESLSPIPDLGRRKNCYTDNLLMRFNSSIPGSLRTMVVKEEYDPRKINREVRSPGFTRVAKL